MIDLRTISTNITSNYGPRKSGFHYGIDLVLKDPNYVPFVLGGEVKSSGYHTLMGNYVRIAQTDGTLATYMHLKHLPTWKTGDIVNEGDKVGVMGSTGNSTGPHLHYEVRNKDLKFVDPEIYFDEFQKGNTNYVQDSLTVIPTNNSKSEYSLLGNIFRFLVILLVVIGSVYLILKSFDI